jgi:hypothetical protein
MEIPHDVRVGRCCQLKASWMLAAFVPVAEVRGIFGDPCAVVIALRRRSDLDATTSGSRWRAGCLFST